MKRITKLDMAQKRNTRRLWETVFSEDSREFVDYYYREKIPDNITYACRVWQDSEPVAMLHLTPYRLEAGRQLFSSFYIVGVATVPEYRHQGIMSEMLIQALKDCQAAGTPFVFLMPANPLIYEPFGFRYIYERSEYEWKSITEPCQTRTCGCLRFREVEKKEYGALCRFVNGYLRENTDYFVLRTEEYYDRLRKELKSQHGHIIGIYDTAGQFAGELLYAREEKIYIQEMLWQQEKLTDSPVEYRGKKPVIMARITNVGNFLKLFRTKGKQVSLTFAVKDVLIPKNSGAYRLEGNRQGCEVTRIREEGNLPLFGVEELVSVFFGMEEGISLSKRGFFEDIAAWKRGCINEIV